jgi:predicted phosphodiesterase
VRYAVFSDVHGNLQALRRVLERMEELGAERRLCLGDTVGYGGNPRECVEEVRRAADRSVAGNHDQAALGLTDLGGFHVQAQTAALWSGRVLDPDHRLYLAGLPLLLDEAGITCVHSSPWEPSEWHYILGRPDADTAFEFLDGAVCLVGHSHVPMAAVRRGSGPSDVAPLTELHLEDGARYILNPGSVGQPRDGDPRASFLLLDTESARVRIERVPYEVRDAQRAILEAGLPPGLAERLTHGR